MAKNILVHSFIFTRLILNATFNFNFFDFAMKLSIQILYYWLEQIMRLLLMCNFCWFCWILLEILPWEDEWFSQLWWLKNDSKRLVHTDFIALINSPDHELSANTKISVIRNIPNFPPLNLALCFLIKGKRPFSEGKRSSSWELRPSLQRKTPSPFRDRRKRPSASC